MSVFDRWVGNQRSVAPCENKTSRRAGPARMHYAVYDHLTICYERNDLADFIPGPLD
jgi:hypothetical protein